MTSCFIWLPRLVLSVSGRLTQVRAHRRTTAAYERLGLGVRTSSVLLYPRSGQNAIDRLKKQLEQILAALRVRERAPRLELKAVCVHQVLRRACREREQDALTKGVRIHEQRSLIHGPDVLLILAVVTIVRQERWYIWHRLGVRRFWRWKSNSRGGRQRIEIESRALVGQISTDNQLWGTPSIHGELLKLGFSVINARRKP